MSLILFTGDRHWTEGKIVNETLSELVITEKPWLAVIHGDCPTGLDNIVSNECGFKGIAEFRCPANWKYYARSAGPIRNEWMFLLPVQGVFAFHSNIKESKGTRDTLKRAVSKGINSYLYNGEKWLNPKKLVL